LPDITARVYQAIRVVTFQKCFACRVELDIKGRLWVTQVPGRVVIMDHTGYLGEVAAAKIPGGAMPFVLLDHVEMDVPLRDTQELPDDLSLHDLVALFNGDQG
jgi:hypothetical protein